MRFGVEGSLVYGLLGVEGLALGDVGFGVGFGSRILRVVGRKGSCSYWVRGSLIRILTLKPLLKLVIKAAILCYGVIRDLCLMSGFLDVEELQLH